MIRVIFSILFLLVTVDHSLAAESLSFQKENSSSICCVTEEEKSQEGPLCSQFSLNKEQSALFKLTSFGVLSGYGRASIHDDHYEHTTLLFQWKYDIKPFLEKKIGFQSSGLIEFIVEPMLSFVYNPGDNAEVGVSFLAQYGHYFTPQFLGFINGGVGGIYTTQHTLEQDTQGNFISQIGGGIYCHLTKNVFLVAEYRFRHLSNAGIKHPNGGIDSDMFLLGISTKF